MVDMDRDAKRKAPATARDERGGKRSKKGTGGKWQTPHQMAKASGPRGGPKVEPGDRGIWATCVKDKEGKATEELKALFEEYASRVYRGDTKPERNGEDDLIVEDIESSIQKELASISDAKVQPKLFAPIHIDMPCVLFFKTEVPVEPVDFVHYICQDAMHNGAKRRHRFVNRLTPMTLSGKATEKGLEDVGRRVLGDHFQLAGEESNGEQESEKTGCSYAIRPTIRNHNTLKRDAVIKLVASLVGPQHKVDLTKPDKVILVEIYQTICGISVVGNDWESLRRFNLAEIYHPSAKHAADGQPKIGIDAIPDPVTKDEALQAEST